MRIIAAAAAKFVEACTRIQISRRTVRRTHFQKHAFGLLSAGLVARKIQQHSTDPLSLMHGIHSQIEQMRFAGAYGNDCIADKAFAQCRAPAGIADIQAVLEDGSAPALSAVGTIFDLDEAFQIGLAYSP